MTRRRLAYLFALGLACIAGPVCAQSATEARPSQSEGLVVFSSGEHEFDDCIRSALKRRAPDVPLVPEERLSAAFFPWLETMGWTGVLAEEFPARLDLLRARADARARAEAISARWVLTLGGSTTTGEVRGYVGCGTAGSNAFGGCLGFEWQDERSTFSAQLRDLHAADPAREEQRATRGRTYIPAFMLPIPIPARTQHAACDALVDAILPLISR